MIMMTTKVLTLSQQKKKNYVILVSGETVNIMSVLQTHTPGGAFTAN